MTNKCLLFVIYNSKRRLYKDGKENEKKMQLKLSELDSPISL
jgi:hypothetical protein